MPAATPVPASSDRLSTRMAELIGEPVTTVARVNVAWLDTVLGLGIITTFFALAVGSETRLGMTLVGTWAVVAIAAVVLRTRGGPLRFGLAGGVAAVSGPTLHIASCGWMTRQPRKMLGSWPREEVVLTRVRRLGIRRLMTVRFPGSDSPAHVEILGRRKDETIADLFGPVRKR